MVNNNELVLKRILNLLLKFYYSLFILSSLWHFKASYNSGCCLRSLLRSTNGVNCFNLNAFIYPFFLQSFLFATQKSFRQTKTNNMLNVKRYNLSLNNKQADRVERYVSYKVDMNVLVLCTYLYIHKYVCMCIINSYT